MSFGATGKDALDVDTLRLALQVAVGDQQEPVPRLEPDGVGPVGECGNPQRRLSVEAERLDTAIPEKERGRVSGVDDLGGAVDKAEPHHQPCDELVRVGVVAQSFTRSVGLLSR